MNNIHLNIHNYNNDVYEIKNFIDNNIIQFLLSNININNDEGWQTQIGIGNIIFFNNEKKFIECLNSINDKILECFINVKTSTGVHVIRRLKTNQYMPPHQDFGYNKANQDIMFGVTLYLNDNFNGGEIFYKELNLKIQPKSGSLLIHRSNILHEVLPVLNGKRYSISTFIKGDESTNLIIK